jgi:hypothetical protein
MSDRFFRSADFLPALPQKYKRPIFGHELKNNDSKDLLSKMKIKKVVLIE